MTHDAFVELSTNFVIQNHLNASRSEQNDDVDLMAILLQLSMLSPIDFEGVRIQLVLGARYIVGSCPGGVGPGNRMSQTLQKSNPGSPPRSTSNEVPLEDVGVNPLLEELRSKEMRIVDIGRMSVDDLKELFRRCFTSGISK